MSAKNAFFLVSRGKNKFHKLWPHPWKNSLSPPGKILPTPMHWAMVSLLQHSAAKVSCNVAVGAMQLTNQKLR